MTPRAFPFVLLLGACSTAGVNAPASSHDAGKPVDSGQTRDASADHDAPSDKSALCAKEFGTELTKAYGRIDGTVLAVVQPKDQQCALPNNDHVILQVLMNGRAYRMVINVESSVAGPDIRVRANFFDHALPTPAWSEGWHTDVSLDYATTLGLRSTADFSPMPLEELSAAVSAAAELGEKVSVYATSSGGASAHLIHRNGGGHDGVVFLHPDGAHPKVLAFHFPEQTF